MFNKNLLSYKSSQILGVVVATDGRSDTQGQRETDTQFRDVLLETGSHI